LIDRPIRPLFPKGYRNDIQIVAQLFSYDQQNQPDTLAMLGASCALMLSGAPFEGPIGAVRVSRDENGNLKECSGNTQIFIYPPYKFKCVDALITNFHLPESTLIMLVAAMCGREEILNVYKTAVNERYRFFSFGDAMLIVGRSDDDKEKPQDIVDKD